MIESWIKNKKIKSINCVPQSIFQSYLYYLYRPLLCCLCSFVYLCRCTTHPGQYPISSTHTHTSTQHTPGNTPSVQHTRTHTHTHFNKTQHTPGNKYPIISTHTHTHFNFNKTQLLNNFNTLQCNTTHDCGAFCHHTCIYVAPTHLLNTISNTTQQLTLSKFWSPTFVEQKKASKGCPMLHHTFT